MKKLALILTFLSAPLFAAQIYSFPENPKLDAELQNNYYEHRFGNFVNLKASTATVTLLKVSSVTLNGVNLSVGTPQPQNILDNGGFEIWQRGTSFAAPANTAYLSDRWVTNTDEAANVTVTKEITTIDVGLASMKVVVASAGASKQWNIIQKVENFADYRGKTVTFSVRMFSSVASALRVGMFDGINAQTFSPYHTGGGGWETLSLTYPVSATATELFVYVGMQASGDKKNGTYYFDSAMLTLGSDVIVFIPTNPAVDMNRSQRFFQVLGQGLGAGEMIALGQVVSTTVSIIPLTYKVKMRSAPTVTVNNQTHFSLNYAANLQDTLSTLNGASITTDSCQLGGTAGLALLTVGFAASLQTNNADATIYLSSDL